MKLLLTIVISSFFFALPVPAQNTHTKLEGQVVCCAECWAEADRNKVEYGTAENLLKAKSCVEGGDPTLLAVREGEKFKLYQLATGKFRLPGKNWLEFVGKRIAVEGTIQKRREAEIIRVDTLAVLAPSIAERSFVELYAWSSPVWSDLRTRPKSRRQLQHFVLISHSTLQPFVLFCGYSSPSPSLPSGFLIPNFSRRYWSVRKVRPNSFAARVML